MTAPALELGGVDVVFRGSWPRLGVPVAALRSVDLSIAPGETVGIVGESSSGKSTLGRVILRLVRPNSGTVRVGGIDPFGLRGADLLAYRRRVQAVFQDSVASLDPRMTIGEAVREGLDIHRIGTRKQREDRTGHLLELVGLGSDYRRRMPHALSGGQRQRINIARALAIDPEVLVADEPVSALDVSVQSQILELFEALQRERNLTLVFISHDLGVVRALCRRVVVLHQGCVVEDAPVEELFGAPRHPYTRELLASVPDIDRAMAARRSLRAIRMQAAG